MPQRYSHIAIILHWLIAALLAFQISVGWALDSLGARGFSLFQIHKSIGITILILTLIRIGVRIAKPRPPKKEGGWQGALSTVVHFGLYIFMLGAPLTGWALVSTAKVKVPTLLFATIPLPHLPLPMQSHHFAETAHGVLAWIGIALFFLHVAGALRHHILLRDGLIWRMIPAHHPALLILLPATLLLAFIMGQLILPRAQTKANAPVVENSLETMNNDNAPSDRSEEAIENISTPPRVVDANNGAENTVAEAQAPNPVKWAVQSGGKLGFSIGNSGEAMKGSFSRWTAKIIMDPDHAETADIYVAIDLKSASVGDAYKDEMLSGDEFFAVSSHPTATFTAKGAEKTGPNAYRANGTLTLKGVSKPQSIRFTLAGTGPSRQVSGSARIARAAFQVGNGDSSGGLDATANITFAFKAIAQ